jgi:hypothetical protein
MGKTHKEKMHQWNWLNYNLSKETSIHQEGPSVLKGNSPLVLSAVA